MKYRLFDTPQPLSGPSQASIDAGFRHRSRTAQGASVIQSIELKELNEKGRRTVVHDLVSICRRRSEEVQLSLHCAFARDEKACFLHGTEEEWRAEIAKGGDAKKAALRLNCFSSGAIRFPLAAQVAEGIGAKVVCMRTLLRGFWVSRISHDQDAHIGKIFLKFFRSQECFDRAHIAVRINARQYIHVLLSMTPLQSALLWM